MKANKLNIFIDKPIKEVFTYSLEANNVPKWITSMIVPLITNMRLYYSYIM